jgi:hypothetical protein
MVKTPRVPVSVHLDVIIDLPDSQRDRAAEKGIDGVLDFLIGAKAQ